MEKKILNEINDMRVKMGLHILNENSILLTEGGVVNTFIDKFIVKTLITTAEKNLVKGFVEGTLSSADKVLFKDFLKRPAGDAFIKEFESAIAAESNPVIAKKAQAYLDNQIKKQIKSTVSSTVSSLPGRSKPGKVVDNIVLDFNLSPEVETIIKKHGINDKKITDEIIKDLRGNQITMSRAEKIQQELAEGMKDIHLKDKTEDLVFKKESNELDLLAKEQKVKYDSYRNQNEKELNDLKVKERQNKITDEEKLRKINIETESHKLGDMRRATFVKRLKFWLTALLITGGITAATIGIKKIYDFINSKSNGGSKTKKGALN